MSTQQISEARLAANRANAQKSTGPRTHEGKAAVANNALKHGLRSERNPLDLANETTLPSEHEEFLATLEAFKEDMNPHGILETRLVERLALLDLRLARAAKMEMTHLDISARRVHNASASALPDEDPTRLNWLTTLAFLHNPNAIDLISRYESRLIRDFAKTLTQLRQTQKSRAQPQPSIAGAIHARSLASDGPFASPTAEIPTEQTQPSAIPTRSHASHGVGVNDAARQISTEQTQRPTQPAANTHAATVAPATTSSTNVPSPLEQEAA